MHCGCPMMQRSERYPDAGSLNLLPETTLSACPLPKSGDLISNAFLLPAAGRPHTPQVWPSKPMVTSSPATMTGTLRTPAECFSIAFMLSDESSTSMYSTSFPCFAKASRAARVCGQVFLPKINTFSDIGQSSFYHYRVLSKRIRRCCRNMFLCYRDLPCMSMNGN